jgi:hypothetical protein
MGTLLRRTATGFEAMNQALANAAAARFHAAQESHA